jgi:outer membrane protein OmpA-like peptidoglycan-associated protein
VILGASGAFVALLVLGPMWAFPLADRDPEAASVVGAADVDPVTDSPVPDVSEPVAPEPVAPEPAASEPEAVDPGHDAVSDLGDEHRGQPARAQAEIDAVVAPVSLVAADGSLAETAEATLAFDLIAAVVSGDEALTVAFVGHTDNTDDATANLLASQRLAASARRQLIERGVPGERVFSFGQGEAQPVTANDTEDGRARNRRLEVVFGIAGR